MPVNTPLFLALVAVTIWIGIDSSRRDWQNDRFSNKPWKWVVGTLCLPIIVIPMYLVRRGRAPLKI